MYWELHMRQKRQMICYLFGEPCYYPEKYPLLYGVYEGTGKTDPDYGRSIATLAGNLHFIQRDYLEPIPLQQIRLNPNLKQNPGW